MSDRKNNEKIMRIAHELNKVTRFLQRQARDDEGGMGKLDRIDLQKQARKYASIEDTLDNLDARIQAQVGHMLRQKNELSKELSKLEKELKNTLPPMKKAVEETKDLIIKYNSWSNTGAAYKKALYENLPKRVREELGDEMAEKILELADDAKEMSEYTYRKMNKFEVIEKRSHVYREAGAIELMTKALDWVKDTVKDMIKFFKTAKDRILGKSEDIKDGFDTIFDAMEV